MENKYFIPSIEDIRVGYECEFSSTMTEGFWVPKSLTKNTISNAIFGLTFSGVRVPYLTKEQIETEGWVHEGGTLSEYSRQDYLFELYKLEYWGLNQNTKIYRKNHIRDGSGRFDWEKIFDGKIPSINEFRILCKWLKIK